MQAQDSVSWYVPYYVILCHYVALRYEVTSKHGENKIILLSLLLAKGVCMCCAKGVVQQYVPSSNQRKKVARDIGELIVLSGL
jgi:hypothetical protein